MKLLLVFKRNGLKGKNKVLAVYKDREQANSYLTSVKKEKHREGSEFWIEEHPLTHTHKFKYWG